MFKPGAAAVIALLLVISGALPTRAADPLPIPPERTAVTNHVVHVDGKTLRYTATAGNILLKNDRDEPTASVFYVAYTVPGPRRPLTFAFNGGPGSSSMWLHLGSIGPRHVLTSDTGTMPVPPYDVVENPSTLLDRTDLVFVDAVGTGFSTLVGKGEGKDFWGVDEDANAFAQFIRRYVARYDRWNAPKYLFGESYGTTRAANLVNILQEQGMAFSGVTLVSTVLFFRTLDSSGPADDLSYELFLPTEAAVAWYHDRVPNRPADLRSFLTDARRFASGEYAVALGAGGSLDAATKTHIAARLHDFIGLPAEYIAQSDLRVPPERFEAELLRDRRKVIGRLDGRYLGAALDPVADASNYDPTNSAISAVFTASLNRYVRDELQWKPQTEYLPTNYGVVNQAWKFSRGGQYGGAVNVAGDLAAALTKNERLRVFSANGYFDLATPFYATEYTLGHLSASPSVLDRITYGYYPSGHMVYMHPPSLVRLKGDLAHFYDTAP